MVGGRPCDRTDPPDECWGTGRDRRERFEIAYLSGRFGGPVTGRIGTREGIGDKGSFNNHRGYLPSVFHAILGAVDPSPAIN